MSRWSVVSETYQKTDPGLRDLRSGQRAMSLVVKVSVQAERARLEP